jgi:hypothetical protein
MNEEVCVYKYAPIYNLDQKYTKSKYLAVTEIHR